MDSKKLFKQRHRVEIKFTVRNGGRLTCGMRPKEEKLLPEFMPSGMALRVRLTGKL